MEDQTAVRMTTGWTIQGVHRDKNGQIVARDRPKTTRPDLAQHMLRTWPRDWELVSTAAEIEADLRPNVRRPWAARPDLNADNIGPTAPAIPAGVGKK